MTHSRRNAGVIAATAAVVALLFLYPTSTNSGDPQRRPGTALAPPGIVSSTGPAGKHELVVNGTSADTRYGAVQVRITVRGSRIVAATAIDYPRSSSRDRTINAYAIPILQRETVAAQSAGVDTVSGATYTSDGYRRSLQAALDAAHLR